MVFILILDKIVQFIEKGLLNNPKEKVQTLSEIGQGLLFPAHQGCG